MKKRGRKAPRRTARMTRKRATVGLIKKVINNQHEKHAYVGAINTTAGSGGTIIDFCNIAQGDSSTQREGDRLTIKSFILRFGLIAADTTQFCRLIIFQWLIDDTATVPTPSHILNGTYINQPYATFAPFNKSNAGYVFVPLWDKQFSMTSGASSSACKHALVKLTPRNFKKKAKAMIQYQSGATSGTGKIYGLFISDSGAVTHPTITGVGQVRFLSS